jgi:hypothetical protein
MRDIGLEADPWQAQVLRSTSDRIAILAPRQVGKSAVVACLALHTALYRDGSLIVIASRSEDQSVELFRKMVEAYDRLDQPVRAIRRLVSEIELDNGSRILALPNNPETVRCYSSVALLILDEASRVPDALIVSVFPMITASRGRLVVLSTPAGRQGFFYQEWSNPYARWERISARADMCPRFDPAFLAELRSQIGETAYRQEMECEFLRSDGQVFSLEVVDDAFDSDLPAIHDF